MCYAIDDAIVCFLFPVTSPIRVYQNPQDEKHRFMIIIPLFLQVWQLTQAKDAALITMHHLP